MSKSKNYLPFPIFIFCITFSKSFACESEVSQKKPQITQHTVKGAGEFIEYFEKYHRTSPGPIHILTEVHGIITKHSSLPKKETSAQNSSSCSKRRKLEKDMDA
ncbi:MAG: hypothetical protein BGO76_06940 [Caedibacter sp. 38-128]|nr:hypothetical protein [Holosporales bacterium]OJX04749.1 MAG: hypothetical protein BGO76_06940 [Caedibacter sp. 38-128]